MDQTSSGGRCCLGRLVGLCRREDAVGVGNARHGALHADRLVAHLHVLARPSHKLGDVVPVGVAVDHDALAAPAAQQLIERHVRPLGLDVPQRHVDRGDRRHRHRPAPPVGAAVEVLPGVLDAADRARSGTGRRAPEIADHRQLAAVQRGVADAVEALVSGDLQRDEVPPRTRDDHPRVDDFVILASCLLYLFRRLSSRIVLSCWRDLYVIHRRRLFTVGRAYDANLSP